MSQIAVVTGDNHLQPCVWSRHPDMREDTYVSFRQIVDYCCEHMLPLFLLGDIFDRQNPDALSVSFFMQQMERMRAAGLAVRFVQGNHDLSTPAWPLLSPGVEKADRFAMNGITFQGIDFTHKQQLQSRISECFADAGKVDVVLAHQAWAEIQGIGHVDGSFSLFPYSLTLLTGDYHVTGMFVGEAADGGVVTAWSPGSTAMQAINERPNKSFYVLHDDLSMSAVPIETRPFSSMSVTSEDELNSFIAGAADLLASVPAVRFPEISKPILSVSYFDSIPEAASRLFAAFGHSTHLFLRVLSSDVTNVVDVENVRSDAFDDLSSAIATLCGNSPLVRDDAAYLLTSFKQGQLTAAGVSELFEFLKHRFEEVTPNDDNARPTC